MNAIERLLRFLLLILAGLTVQPSLAAEERWVRSAHGTGIQGSTLTIHDPESGYVLSHLGSSMDRFSFQSAQASVVFRLDDTHKQQLPTCSLTLSYTIFLRYTDGSGGFETGQLVIGYDAAGTNTYTDEAIRTYDNVLWATVGNVTVTPSGISTVPDDAYLDLVLDIDRTYELMSTERPTALYRGASNGYLTVDWDYVEGAEAYDLEWLFVEATGHMPNPSALYDLVNATRITTTGHTYDIPLAYPEGVLLWRIRGIGKDRSTGARKEGAWQGPPSTGNVNAISAGSLYRYNLTNGLEPFRNWQYTASYAEQGKRKELLSFFDGSLRTRQSRTILNTEGYSLLDQKIYDMVGRPSLQLLPYAVPGRSLAFLPGQARIATGNDYRFEEFDLDGNFSSPSSFPPVGSGAFYSTNNTGALGTHGKYMASAQADITIPPNDPGNQLLPFSRTRFLNDGSGRPREEAGPGLEHGMAGTHTVRHVYGSPGSQFELDRLFGSEVGPVSNYKKTLTIDPNGVTTVAYTDLAGRTVATALASTAAQSPALTDVGGYDGINTSITADLHQLDLPDPDGAITKTYAFATPTVLHFTYTLADEQLQYCVDNDCVYDLRIKLIDNETGEPVALTFTTHTATPPGGTTEVIPITGALDEFQHAGFTNIDLVFESPLLSPGSYTLQKVLTLNEQHIADMIEDYRTAVTASGLSEPCPQLTEIPDLECANCETLCEGSYSYTDLLGTVHYHNAMGMTITQQQYQDLYDACLDDCQNPDEPDPADISPCESKRLLMEHDMSPGGQYFDNFPLQLHTLGATNPNPVNGWLTAHFWADGNIRFSQAGFGPGIDTWDEVRANWDPSWLYGFPDGTVTLANSETRNGFLSSHPEFCTYLFFCDKNCSNSFYATVDDQIPPEPTYYADLLLGPEPTDITSSLFNPVNMPQHAAYDPDAYQPADPVLNDDDADGPMICVSDDLADCAEAMAIEDRLLKFLPVDPSDPTPTYLTLWYVVNDPSHVLDYPTPPFSPATMAVFQALHGGTTPALAPFGVTPTGQQISRFQFFRSVYLAIRESVAWQIYLGQGECTSNTATCTRPVLTDPDMNGFTDDHFAIRYPMPFLVDMQQLMNDPGALADLLGSMQQNAEGQTDEGPCVTMIDGWTDRLENCTIPTIDREAILALIADNDLCTHALMDTPLSGTTPVLHLSDGSDHTITDLDDLNTLLATEFECGPLQLPPMPPDPDNPPTATECACQNLFNAITGVGLDPHAASLVDGDHDELGPILDVLTEMNSDPVDYEASMLITYVNICNASTPTTLGSTFPDGLLCTEPPTEEVLDCPNGTNQTDIEAIQHANEELVSAAATAYETMYRARCMQLPAEQEVFTMSYQLSEYHYTLYYYDQAGNLLKTVPPEGIHMGAGDYVNTADLNAEFPDLDAVQTAVQAHRDHPESAPFIRPGHTMVSWYGFDSFQHPLVQRYPDHDANTTFFYDALGRVVASQDPEQAAHAFYSYTLYDALGRPFESGQCKFDSPLGSTSEEAQQMAQGLNEDAPKGFYDPAGSTDGFFNAHAIDREQITRTYYDTPLGGYAGDVNTAFGANGQQNIGGRVSSATFQEVWNSDPLAYDQATHYSYDIHGNVNTLLQENKGLAGMGQGFKHIDYEYDLISGNVNAVHYQAGQWDAFHHRYRYDADNRLLEVRTSHDGINWERDARQFYYATGPLARLELGRKQVQGIDNTYTLQGWLRATNAASLSAADDPGQDGTASGPNGSFTQDAFAFGLNYYNGDYRPVGGATRLQHLPDVDGDYGTAFNAHQLYNGNIPGMLVALRKQGDADATASNDYDPLPLQAHTYTYDLLNRIRTQNVFTGTATDNGDAGSRVNLGSLTDPGPDGPYANSFAYDHNGNLTGMQKYGNAGIMDDFGYTYPLDADNHLLNNRLQQVDDDAPDNAYATDLDDQAADNYAYLEDGNLAQDTKAEIGQIIWNVQNKVRHVRRTEGSTLPDLEFHYGPGGQRTVKIVKPRPGGNPSAEAAWTYTYYIHDAQGNPMAIYERTTVGSGSTRTDRLEQRELPLYGGKRLGTWMSNRSYAPTFTPGTLTSVAATSTQLAGEQRLSRIYTTPLPATDDGLGTFPRLTTLALGHKRYELMDHRGNVMSLINDRRVSQDLDANGLADRYLPVQLDQTYYYPFGDQMPVSGTVSDSYRFAFNGQEKVDEINGSSGTHNTAEFWEYDTRTGRRWNIDPVIKYPESPFATFGNNPIWFGDPNGMDSTKVNNTWYWKVEQGDSYWSIGKRTGVDYKLLQSTNSQEADELAMGSLLSISGSPTHFVYANKTPKIYALTSLALVISPEWSALNYLGPNNPLAESNRDAACRDEDCAYPAFECDEFPYASTAQGGFGAWSDCVPSIEQRIQGGQLAALYSKLIPGQAFNIELVGPQRPPAPVLDPSPEPSLRKVPVPNTPFLPTFPNGPIIINPQWQPGRISIPPPPWRLLPLIPLIPILGPAAAF